eukprot:658892-Amorphochlora_amoeboformis.AAC.1
MKVDLRYPALFGILAFFFILTTQQAIFGFETTSSSTLSTVGDSTGRKKPPSFFASPNTVTGLESEVEETIEHWTPPAEVRAMNVCVSVYNDKHPDKGFESQVWPSPICERGWILRSVTFLRDSSDRPIIPNFSRGNWGGYWAIGAGLPRRDGYHENDVL